MRTNKNDKIPFLPNPKLNPNDLNYIKTGTKDVYANLFEIQLKKDLSLYQYPLSIFPDVGEGDIRIRSKIFKACSKSLRDIYGECFISGNSLYGTNRIEKKQIIDSKLILKNVEKEKTEYFLEIQKFAKEKIIKLKDIKNDPLGK